jgi:hypothetical protein
VYFVLRKRDVPFPTIFWLFGAFILACGTTHLMEAIIFWYPVYRLAGIIKLLTALVHPGRSFGFGPGHHVVGRSQASTPPKVDAAALMQATDDIDPTLTGQSDLPVRAGVAIGPQNVPRGQLVAERVEQGGLLGDEGG